MEKQKKSTAKLKKFLCFILIIAGIYAAACLLYYTVVYVFGTQYGAGGNAKAFPNTQSFEQLCDGCDYSGETVGVKYRSLDADGKKVTLSAENAEAFFALLRGQNFRRVYFKPVLLGFSTGEEKPICRFIIENEYYPAAQRGKVVTKGISLVDVYGDKIVIAVCFEDAETYAKSGDLVHEYRAEYASGDRELVAAAAAFAEKCSALPADPAVKYKTLDKRIFTVGAKAGIYSESGEVLVSAQYDEITALDGFFACRKALGSRMGAVRGADGTREYGEVPSSEYDLILPSGSMVGEGAFDGYNYYDDTDECEIIGTKYGNCYHYMLNYKDGSVTLSGFDAGGTLPTDCGFTINYLYENGSRDRLFGILNADGSTAVPPIYNYVAVPFADRFLLYDGAPQQGFVCSRCNITDPDGNVINSSFNAVVYSSFGGEYIGIACSFGENSELACYTDGEITPAGYWFVDKDGKILSERFDEITISEFDSSNGEFMDSMLTAADENTVITVTLDGAAEEITAKDVLEKYYK